MLLHCLWSYRYEQIIGGIPCIVQFHVRTRILAHIVDRIAAMLPPPMVTTNAIQKKNITECIMLLRTKPQ